VKYGNETGELDDEVVVIPREENQIDLGQHLYEYLVLSLPVRRIHPDDTSGNSTCDRRMMEKLKNHIVAEESENNDPRWDELKKLMDKN